MYTRAHCISRHRTEYEKKITKMTNSTINRIASAQKQGNPEDGSSPPFPNFPSSAHDPDALFLCKVLLENESSDTRAKKIPARTVPRARLRPSYMHKIKNKQGGRRKKKRGTEIMETAAQTQDAPSTSKRYTTHRVTKTRNDIQTQSILSKSKNEKEQNGA